MSVPQKCERCEEPVEKVSLEKLPLIGRFTGYVSVEVTKRTIRLQSIRQRFSKMGAYERPHYTHTDVTLCDQCWGAFLSWVCEPGQERRKTRPVAQPAYVTPTREQIAYVIHPAYQRKFTPETCASCAKALEQADAVLALITKEDHGSN